MKKRILFLFLIFSLPSLSVAESNSKSIFQEHPGTLIVGLVLGGGIVLVLDTLRSPKNLPSSQKKKRKKTREKKAKPPVKQPIPPTSTPQSTAPHLEENSKKEQPEPEKPPVENHVAPLQEIVQQPPTPISPKAKKTSTQKKTSATPITFYLLLFAILLSLLGFWGYHSFRKKKK